MGSQMLTLSQTRPRCVARKASWGDRNHCTSRNPCGTQLRSPEQTSAWQHSSRNPPLWHSHQTACKETRHGLVLSSAGKTQKEREGEQHYPQYIQLCSLVQILPPYTHAGTGLSLCLKDYTARVQSAMTDAKQPLLKQSHACQSAEWPCPLHQPHLRGTAC